jgi:hypothetical protein
MKRLSVIILVMVFALVFARDAYTDDQYRHSGYGEAVVKLGLVNGKVAVIFLLWVWI